MKNKSLFVKMGAVLAVVGFSGMASADVGRGMDVEPRAGVCPIGTFPQTSKAGPYNVLCNVMQDNEKCLAFIKGHFNFDGNQTVTLDQVAPENIDKGRYCLEVLKNDLGLN